MTDNKAALRGGDPMPRGEPTGALPAEAAPGTADTRRARLVRLWPVALVVAGLGLAYLLGAGDYISLDYIVREHEALAALVNDHLFVSAVVYVVIYAVAVAVSFPGASLITIAGGFLFGVWLGTALAVFAATHGAAALFLAARSSFGAFLRRKVAHRAGRFAKGFSDNAFSYLFLLRLVPIFPFWLVNIVPTLFDVPLRTYLVATALGIIPGTLAYALLGDGLGATIDALEAADPGCASAGTCKIGFDLLLAPGPLIAMAALCIVALIPIVVKKIRVRTGKPL